jgi:type II secretory pathway pseudopilin PulG
MSRTYNSAFTFIESLVVILITILLASIVIPGLKKKDDEEVKEIEFTIPASDLETPQ